MFKRKISENTALKAESLIGTPAVIVLPWFLHIIYVLIAVLILGILAKKGIITKN
jgi:hypothetical protein